LGFLCISHINIAGLPVILNATKTQDNQINQIIQLRWKLQISKITRKHSNDTQKLKKSINQSINQLIDRSINQLIDRSIKMKSINQPTKTNTKRVNKLRKKKKKR